MAPSNNEELEKTKKKKKRENKYAILENILDDLVTVNSFSTVAVFVGLAFTSRDELQSLQNKKECDPNPTMAKNLLLYEVLSFSLFLFSTLFAKAFKALLKIVLLYHDTGIKIKGIKIEAPKYIFPEITLILPTLTTVGGCICLIQSMNYIMWIRFGKWSCQTDEEFVNLNGLSVIAYTSVVTYYLIMMGVFTILIKHGHTQHQGTHGADQSVQNTGV